MTVFKGPSGSGKTTLLSIIGCMAKPTGRPGLRRRAGRSRACPSASSPTSAARTFGFIFQQFHLIRGISALENVMLPAYPTGEPHARPPGAGAAPARAVRACPAKADSRVEWLSGGEAQRVAIARALINEPAVVIADEPTAHLDTKLSRDFMAGMERLKAEGKTILIASHDPLVYESAMVDRVVEMRDGRIIDGAARMILHPAILALLIGSFLVLGMIVYAAWWGWQVIGGWDLQSGSERQLLLEKKTYLVSTLMVYAFAFQILSFFLLVYVADDLHRLFVGAMCAAGTLNVNEYGYPAVVLKVLNCVLAGVWLVLNHADNRAVDYPLIRRKYTLLLVILPLVAVEAYYQAVYFLNLKADVITSCCGSLFSADETGVGAGLAGLPIGPTAAAFAAVLAAALLSGAAGLWTRRWTRVLAVSGTLALPVSVAALISFISLYFYELPTHHCPFCILQREYGYVGYLIYATLLVRRDRRRGVVGADPARPGPQPAARAPPHPPAPRGHGRHRLRAVRARRWGPDLVFRAVAGRAVRGDRCS